MVETKGLKQDRQGVLPACRKKGTRGGENPVVAGGEINPRINCLSIRRGWGQGQATGIGGREGEIADMPEG